MRICWRSFGVHLKAGLSIHFRCTLNSVHVQVACESPSQFQITQHFNFILLIGSSRMVLGRNMGYNTVATCAMPFMLCTALKTMAERPRSSHQVFYCTRPIISSAHAAEQCLLPLSLLFSENREKVRKIEWKVGLIEVNIQPKSIA